uniref:Probable inactive ATP-dependent zinc metalloprotease FTSHI 2, chloroplastic n=1 Tax=Tanacetum cinerariifolium TaxID=118510 RepID=A0A6L2L7K8_TANCI|nr:probable inactive ATP-dependent zinc metalloprotease FTSHI 2, chloroplastic [Tanacetum cinerariifolium]
MTHLESFSVTSTLCYEETIKDNVKDLVTWPVRIAILILAGDYRESGLIKGSGGQEPDATLNQVHARKKPMFEDVDYVAVVAMTDGMVDVELANIVEVAAINMMCDGKTEYVNF